MFRTKREEDLGPQKCSYNSRDYHFMKLLLNEADQFLPFEQLNQIGRGRTCTSCGLLSCRSIVPRRSNTSQCSISSGLIQPYLLTCPLIYRVPHSSRVHCLQAAPTETHGVHRTLSVSSIIRQPPFSSWRTFPLVLDLTPGHYNTILQSNEELVEHSTIPAKFTSTSTCRSPVLACLVNLAPEFSRIYLISLQNAGRGEPTTGTEGDRVPGVGT